MVYKALMITRMWKLAIEPSLDGSGLLTKTTLHNPSLS